MLVAPQKLIHLQLGINQGHGITFLHALILLGNVAFFLTRNIEEA